MRELPNPIESLIYEGNDIDQESVEKLLAGHKWNLIYEYMKRKPSQRVEQVLLVINFDFVKPENHDLYVITRDSIKQLIAKEQPGVIDATIRESIELLLKGTIRDVQSH
ncbi:MAG: hypothetical protein A2735_01515 [Candidatus Yanofskybacteria bacterium RIFCSPHIGHO2_01_FULL_41_21]|uniref:Uncharacterized protein n=1 Tax=Candidatus Yanofskybacteria bacterium RIFCSPHIGHO2_01_FULL_41_21 TaxID=1802660 RepID=A0A1F8EBQ6_9BACT|nr:MAG: hypothetical protein A2735_01515 [Candidatus Yanofskybacteria bacterium RIFCSPHIGHO2_01_FULL_41_21]